MTEYERRLALYSASNASPSQGDAMSEYERRLRLYQGSADEKVAKPKKPSLLFRALDVLSRGNYATANAVKAIGEGGNPLVEAWHGLKGEDKTTYGQVLEQFIPEAPKPVRGILGFVLDVALDPTTYVGIGAATKVGKAVKLLDSAGDTIQEGSKLWKLGEDLADMGIDKAVGRTLGEQAGKGQRALVSFAGKPVIKGEKAFDAAESLWDAVKSTPVVQEFATKTRTRPLQVPLAKVMRETGKSRIEVQEALKGAESAPDFVAKVTGEEAGDTAKALAKNTYDANALRREKVLKVEAEEAKRVRQRLLTNEVQKLYSGATKVARDLGVTNEELWAAIGEHERKGGPLTALAATPEVRDVVGLKRKAAEAAEKLPSLIEETATSLKVTPDQVRAAMAEHSLGAEALSPLAQKGKVKRLAKLQADIAEAPAMFAKRTDEHVAKTKVVHGDFLKAVDEHALSARPTSELAARPEVMALREELDKVLEDTIGKEQAAGIDIEALTGELRYTPRRLTEPAKEILKKMNDVLRLPGGMTQDFSVALKAQIERNPLYKNMTISELNALAKKGEMTIGGVAMPAIDELYRTNPYETLLMRLTESNEARTAYELVQKVVKEFGVEHAAGSVQGARALDKQIKAVGKELKALKQATQSKVVAEASGAAWDAVTGGDYTAAKQTLAALEKSYPKDSQLGGTLRYLGLKIDNLVKDEAARISKQSTGKMPGTAEAAAEAKRLAQVAGATKDVGAQAPYTRLRLEQEVDRALKGFGKTLTPKEIAALKKQAMAAAGMPGIKTSEGLQEKWARAEVAKQAKKATPGLQTEAKQAAGTASTLGKQNAFSGMSANEARQYVKDALKEGATGRPVEGLVSARAAEAMRTLTGALDDAAGRYAATPGQKGEMARLRRSVAQMEKTPILSKDEVKKATKGALEENPDWKALLDKKTSLVESKKLPEGFKRIAGLTDSKGNTLKGSENMVLPEAIASQVLSHWGDMTKQKNVDTFTKVYDQLQGVFKKYVTFPYPSYLFRNVGSNLWQAVMNSDMRSTKPAQVAWDLLTNKSGKALAKTGEGMSVVDAAGRTHAFELLWDKAEEGGLMGGGLHGADVGKRATSILEEGSPAERGFPGFKGLVDDFKSIPGNIESLKAAYKDGGVRGAGKAVGGALNDNRLIQRAIGWNSFFEDHARLSVYVDQVLKGKSYEDAIAEAKRVMYDVADMTDWEQKYAKRLASFYSWQRKNLPVALKTQIQSPGKAVLPAKIRNNVSDGSIDIEKDTPAWAQDSAAAAWGGKMLPLGSYMPTLAGAQTIAAPGQSMVRSLSPIIKSAVNLATGANIERGYKFRDKKDMYLNTLKQVPIVGRPISEYEAAGRSTASPLEQVLGYFTGVKRYDTPSAIAAAAKAKKKAEKAVPHLGY